MGIQIREAKSEEMIKNIHTVKKMTKGMGFDENMGNVNWPFVSPIFGDYTDFPPTFITCDYNETLYADAKALYKKCEQAGVDVELVEMKGGFHAFAPIGTGCPETKQILEENIAFMHKYV